MPRKPYAGTQIGPDGKRHPIGEAPQVPVTAEEVSAGAESKVESTEPASPPSGVTDSAPKSAPAKKTPPKKKKVGVKIPDAPTGADLMSDPGPGGDIFSSEGEKEEKEAESIKGSNSDLTDSSIEDVRAELEAARAADDADGGDDD